MPLLWWAELTVHLLGGRDVWVTLQNVVATIGPGSYFGEVGLLHNIPRTATVVSQEVSELLWVNNKEFQVCAIRVPVQESLVVLDVHTAVFLYQWRVVVVIVVVVVIGAVVVVVIIAAVVNVVIIELVLVVN